MAMDLSSMTTQQVKKENSYYTNSPHRRNYGTGRILQKALIQTRKRLLRRTITTRPVVKPLDIIRGSQLTGL